MITIIPNDIQHIDSLVHLFDLYRIFYKYNSDKIEAKNFLLSHIQNKTSVIYLAQTNTNDIVGFVQCYPLFSSTRMKKLWLLNDLFVLQEYRNLGIAKKLMDEVKTLCKQSNACGILLETAKTNHPGNYLYPKENFHLETDCNYYFWNNA